MFSALPESRKGSYESEVRPHCCCLVCSCLFFFNKKCFRNTSQEGCASLRTRDDEELYYLSGKVCAVNQLALDFWFWFDDEPHGKNDEWSCANLVVYCHNKKPTLHRINMVTKQVGVLFRLCQVSMCLEPLARVSIFDPYRPKARLWKLGERHTNHPTHPAWRIWVSTFTTSRTGIKNRAKSKLSAGIYTRRKTTDWHLIHR